MFKNKYRVVTDDYSGYECQVRYWWFPLFWFQVDGINTFPSLRLAKESIENKLKKKKFKSKVVSVWDDK